MFEFLGLFYGIAKDIKDYIEWNEEEKLVSKDWLDLSGFLAQSENNCRVPADSARV
jgi:hypothetical protein